LAVHHALSDGSEPRYASKCHHVFYVWRMNDSTDDMIAYNQQYIDGVCGAIRLLRALATELQDVNDGTVLCQWKDAMTAQKNELAVENRNLRLTIGKLVLDIDLSRDVQDASGGTQHVVVERRRFRALVGSCFFLGG
jgi:hypothetical protein